MLAPLKPRARKGKSLSVEHDVSEILAHFEERRQDKWGEQAKRVSDGIRQSGLAEQFNSSIVSLAAVVGVSSSVIASQIARSNSFLDEIATSVKNPLATAAAERFHRGMNALTHGWWSDAILEFNYSVDPVTGNPYFALAHALLGQAHLGADDPGSALASLERAIHYSTPEEPHLTAGCALLASKILEELQRSDEAAKLIAPVAHAQRHCPETSLVAARLLHDGSLVKQALWLAPELALAAVAAGTPGAVDAADALASDEEGPVRQATRIINALEILRSETYPNSGVPIVPTEAQNLAIISTPEALQVASQILGNAAELARQATGAAEQAGFEDNRRTEEGATLNTKYRQTGYALDRATIGRRDGRVAFRFLATVNVVFWALVVISFWGGPFLAIIFGFFGGIFNAFFTGALLIHHHGRDKFDVPRLEQQQREALSALKQAAGPEGNPGRRALAVDEIFAVAELRTNRLRPWSAPDLRET
ncbi:MAG: hypothetical protein QOD50_411 [Actinomycetota bacterium]|jgi:hypothetical protein|nr:hypothetical protein [Actinomycetota bacterium]